MNYQQIKTIVFYILSKEVMTYEDRIFLNENGTYEMILDYIEEISIAVDPDELFENEYTISVSELINEVYNKK